MAFDRLIPSMFHRRLALLFALLLIPISVIAAQTARLTIGKGAELRTLAEAKLQATTFTPTVRGRVLDRKGRVLAQDRPTYDIAVDYSVLTGEWAIHQAGRAARRDNRRIWPELSRDEREELMVRALPVFQEHLEGMWDLMARTAEISREELDQRRVLVTAEIRELHKSIAQRRAEREQAQTLARGREITTEVSEEIEERAWLPIREQQQPHVLASRVPDSVAFAFMRLVEQTAELDLSAHSASGSTVRVPLMPGMHVMVAGDREYPFEIVPVDLDRSTFPSPIRGGPTDTVTVDTRGVATHILGWMGGEARQEDIQRRAALLPPHDDTTLDRGRYLPGDPVGRAGVEASQEFSLRGLRGVATQQRDTGERSELPPQNGKDIRLTLDIMLQARIQALMTPSAGLAMVQDWHRSATESENPLMPTGTPLNGAAAVLDIDTGDVLALVSMPTFTRQDMRRDPDAVFRDPVNTPYVNRAIAAKYQPGSITKALVLCGAIKSGEHALGQRVACTGHLLPNDPNRYRCWIFKRFSRTHTAQLGHDPDAVEALAVSCNIFFYTLGRKLGPEGIIRTYREFGLGQPFNLGIGDEFLGALGASAANASPDRLSIGDAIMMGIGQGPVAWTPLHAADTYATLARGQGGIRITPRIIMDDRPPTVTDINLNPASVAEAMQGLLNAVNDRRGTGHHLPLPEGGDEPIFNAQGVTIWGKTGTADSSPIVIDPDNTGPLPPAVVRDGDHSWFVVIVGAKGQGPRYVISVVMEYAGSGGKVSGPIANQIIHALIKEGYL